MIKQVKIEEIPLCVGVIKRAFGTVALEFGFTAENAPRFTAFAISKDRLLWQFNNEDRVMWSYWDNDRIVGYYSVKFLGDGTAELNNLAVLPEYRHRGIGGKLLDHAFSVCRDRRVCLMKIGIVEENRVLRHWYESYGFEHTGVEKLDFFPFTCGYLEKKL